MWEETELRLTPMVPIGGQPIVWHIKRTYAHYGFRPFGELKVDGDGVVEFEEKSEFPEKWANTAKKVASFGPVHRDPA